MKIAVLITGHLFDRWEVLKSQFIEYYKDYDIDVFVDTYREKTYKPSWYERCMHCLEMTPAAKSGEDFTDEEFKELFSGINVRLFNVERTQVVLDKVTPIVTEYPVNSARHPPCNWICLCAQTYKIKQGFLLMENYADTNNITYDIVIKTRPDVIYNNEQIPKLFPGCTDEINIYSAGIEEELIIGSMDQLRYFCSMYDYIPKFHKELSYTHIGGIKTLRKLMGIPMHSNLQNITHLY